MCLHEILFNVKFTFLGGAMKPSNVEPLWVHVTCAWFQPEVSFLSDEKMEPAVGILRIPERSFIQVECCGWSYSYVTQFFLQ